MSSDATDIKHDELYIVEGRMVLEFQRIADILANESYPISSDQRRDMHQSMRHVFDLRYEPIIEHYEGGLWEQDV